MVDQILFAVDLEHAFFFSYNGYTFVFYYTNNMSIIPITWYVYIDRYRDRDLLENIGIRSKIISFPNDQKRGNKKKKEKSMIRN